MLAPLKHDSQCSSDCVSNQIRLLGCFYLLCNKQHIEALYVSPAHCQGSGYYIYVSETSQTTWCTAEADEEDEASVCVRETGLVGLPVH